MSKKIDENRINEIRNKYNDTKVKKGFEEQLSKNLDIVETAESRDAYGRLRVPVSQLEANEDYKRAKAWLAANAKWTVDPDIQKEIHEAYKALGYKGTRSEIFKVVTKKLVKEGKVTYDEYLSILNDIKQTSKFIEKTKVGRQVIEFTK